MRIISAQTITDVVKRLCIEVNCMLPRDIRNCIESSYAEEPWPQAKEILGHIIENYKIAQNEMRPICQDTGLTCVFLSVGQDVHIDGNLTENLTLRSLAENFNVSPSYLSSLFRKETGYTLTDYINRRRVRHAMHLLKTTRLQVQTVAQHCGMMDVQYFSKIFKKVAGMTPKEYRNSVSQTAGG